MRPSLEYALCVWSPCHNILIEVGKNGKKIEIDYYVFQKEIRMGFLESCRHLLKLFSEVVNGIVDWPSLLHETGLLLSPFIFEVPAIFYTLGNYINGGKNLIIVHFNVIDHFNVFCFA